MNKEKERILNLLEKYENENIKLTEKMYNFVYNKYFADDDLLAL